MGIMGVCACEYVHACVRMRETDTHSHTQRTLLSSLWMKSETEKNQCANIPFKDTFPVVKVSGTRAYLLPSSTFPPSATGDSKPSASAYGPVRAI